MVISRRKTFNMCEVNFFHHININICDLYKLIEVIEDNERCDSYYMYLKRDCIDVDINSTMYTLNDLDLDLSEGPFTNDVTTLNNQ